jgi:hypothetical protein
MQTNEITNTAKGRNFQQQAARILGQHFGVRFCLEYPITIGDPPKKHKFDLASDNLMYVGECKNIDWTESGNVPSARLAHLNEAVFYLQHITSATCRFIAIPRRSSSKRGETLAEYYHRTNKHLLNGVVILEIDTSKETARELTSVEPPCTEPPLQESKRRLPESAPLVERDVGGALADCYTILLGEEYMNMISQLYKINQAKAVALMRGDLDVVFGKRPKKTKEEIDRELEDFFAENAKE